MAALRILLADGHEVMRRGLRQLLEQRADWEVCGEASTGQEAVAMAARLMPHVVVLELAMPGLNGVEAIRQIRKAQPSTEVLIFSLHESEDVVRAAFAAGARGFLGKSDTAALIVLAVETLAMHKPYFNATVAETILDGFIRHAKKEPPSDFLSPREREIVQLIATGKHTKQIAELLGITPKTVETHRTKLMEKIEAHSIVDVVRWAFRKGLTEI